MATKETKTSAAKDPMNIDSKMVRELAKLLNENDLSEIEVEDGSRKIKVTRQMTVAVQNIAAAPAATLSAPQAAPAASASQASPTPAASAAPISAAPAPEAAPDANAQKSPMVGTVYLSSEPGAAPFISIGKNVSKGDTILIVEAMKVMNPIVAEKTGVISAILVTDSQPVEFDQPLVVID